MIIIMKNGHEIIMVYGTQRAIRRAIDALVADNRPVFDVEVKPVGVFWHIATIITDRPHRLTV